MHNVLGEEHPLWLGSASLGFAPEISGHADVQLCLSWTFETLAATNLKHLLFPCLYVLTFADCTFLLECMNRSIFRTAFRHYVILTVHQDSWELIN